VAWSSSEFVARVIVQTARATGQTVRQVASESFALTLWTWGMAQRISRDDAVERMGERTDMAGLVAVAFHEPAKLQQAEYRYLQAAGRLQATLQQARARGQALVDQIERAQVIAPEA
jgi:hypothetical protein